MTTRSFVLAVDKPAGPTSHDVVSWARRALGTRAVGHAGTLDPAATGVLVLAVNEATKLVPYLSVDDKEYEAVIALGRETDTLDAEGQVVRECPVPALDLPAIREIARGFVGPSRQRAPVFSAIKRGGVALHERARRGETVEEPERDVLAHAVEIRSFAEGRIEAHLHVAKGYYVRSFARDLARALGTVGHLVSLRRTRSGAFGGQDAVPGALLRAARDGDADARAALETAVMTHGRALAQAVPHLRALPLTEALERDTRHGKPVAHPEAEALLEAEHCLLVREAPSARVLVAIARREGTTLRVVRGFAPDQDAVER